MLIRWRSRTTWHIGPKLWAVYIPSAFGLLAGAAVVVSASRYGIGLTPDSVNYLFAAHSLLAGHGLTGFDGPLVSEAPLYPTVLAIGMAVGFSGQTAAVIVAILCAALLLFLSARRLFVQCRSRFLAVIGTLAILLAAPLLHDWANAWSESLLLCLVVVALLQLERAMDGRSQPAVVYAGIATGLACVTRYAGIALLVSGAIVVVVKGEHRVRNSLQFLIPGCAPILVWIVHNELASHTATGARVRASYSLYQGIHDSVVTTFAWFLPRTLSIRRAELLVMILVVGWLSRQRLKDGGLMSSIDLSRIVPNVVFVLTYEVILLWSTTSTALDPIADRYLSPIYVPVIFIVIAVLNALYAPKTSLAQVAISGVLLLGMLVPAHLFLQAERTYASQGSGQFHTVRWIRSPLMSYLQHHRIHGFVYTNEPYGVYILTGQTFHQSPERVFYASNVPTHEFAQFKRMLRARGGRGTLVWFDHYGEGLYGVADMRKVGHIFVRKRLRDGAIFTIRQVQSTRP